MFARSVLLLGLCVALFLGMPRLMASTQEEDSPRGIFDTQTKQVPSGLTNVRPRTEKPKRQNLPGSKKKDVAPVAKSNMVALKYSVLASGTQTPPGYEVGRNLTKIQPVSGEKPYGVTNPQRNFRQGDIIFLCFEVSQEGYLYVINLGSDGVTRSLIYPDPGKPARVLPDEPMTIGPLRIDPPAGTDKLTVLFSKTRISAFEDPKQDLNKVFHQELSSRTYTTIEEEEIYLPSKEILAMYFANKGELLKAEIDVRHSE
ncbi:MAG: DUF4384 domain-containing protein [Acidobacteria bacterium]|nr:DUF4384 domain-containing protein [Acidobacteriota bacterium]